MATPESIQKNLIVLDRNHTDLEARGQLFAVAKISIATIEK